MRLFIAIPIPSDVRKALSSSARKLESFGGTGRFVPESNYHVTLHFIGESNALTDITSSMHNAVKDARPFLLRLCDYGFFRSGTGHTGYIKVSDSSGELQSLYEILEQSLWDCGFSKNRSSLLPHITIGRNIHGDNGFHFLEKIAFTADSIVLYQSRRTAKGDMEYIPLHKEPFGR